MTVNAVFVLNVPLGPATLIRPVLAPDGAVAMINVLEGIVNCAAVPLNCTEVVPFRLVPVMRIFSPTLPIAGCSTTKGDSPADNLKIVP